MFKYINKIVIATALVALLLTSCTDEADVLDNKPIINKKTLTQPTVERPYPGLEESGLSSQQAIELVSIFDKAMKGDTIISSIDIKRAVSAMETYFNYGVVAKQEIVDTTTYYTGSNFQFEVNIDAQENINGAELVDAYTVFLNNFLQQMNGKYLQFSDLFVKAVGNGKVMFALEIPSFTEYDRILWEPHKCKILNSPDGLFEISGYQTINLSNFFINTNSSYFGRMSELCTKYVYGFTYEIQTRNLEQENIWLTGLAGPEPLFADYFDLENTILPSAIRKANNQFFGYDYIKTELLIRGLKTFIYDSNDNNIINGINVGFYLAKVKAGLYDFTPNWLILDNIIF